MERKLTRNSILIPSDKVIVQSGKHLSCHWNPKSDFLAAGSRDKSASVWNVENGKAAITQAILDHDSDVLTIDWSRDGEFLATGTKDGCIVIIAAGLVAEKFIVSKMFQLPQTSIVAVRWNKAGSVVLSAQDDKTVILWNVDSGNLMQKFAFHDSCITDITWQSDDTFASCADKVIHVCKLGETSPIMTYCGHTRDINQIEWNAVANLLASSSCDSTIKIWKPDQNTFVYNLRGHDRNVTCIQWSPTALFLLASASCDHTVKLWNVDDGTMLYTFTDHSLEVQSVAFSPNGKLLASGSLDCSICIWRLGNHKRERHYLGEYGITKVCWNRYSDTVAARHVNGGITFLFPE